MLGNFSYCNPTKLYFGENSLFNLSDELKKYGDNVVLVYGTGSIKKNGIYDDIIKILKESSKNITEIEGVMPNPTVEKLYEGIEIAKNHNADFILAVGGGSVCDFSKALSVSVNCNDDPWEKYFVRFEEPDCEIIPIGCVLTMVGNRLGNERRLCNYKSEYQRKNRSYLCRRNDYAEIYNPQSSLYNDIAEIPNGVRNL